MTITTWQDTHPVKPDPASGLYLRPDGTTAIPARRVIEWAYPAPGQPTRNNAVRAACATHARHLAGKGPPVNMDRVSADARPAVARLVGHRFWERLEVLGAPVHTNSPGDPFATTVDLLVMTKEGGQNAVATIQTAPKGDLRPEAVLAELGAAIFHLSDTHNMLIPKAFVIWALPERLELEMMNVDSCTIEWYQAIQLSRWDERQRQNPTITGQ